MGVRDILDLTKAVIASTSIVIIADHLTRPDDHPLPMSAVVIAGGMVFLAFGSFKPFGRIKRRLLYDFSGEFFSRVLIVGAGNIGHLLAGEMVLNPAWRYKPVCFVDDDQAKQGMVIHGVPVRGRRDDIPRLVEKYAIDVIAIAIPSANGQVVQAIIRVCEQPSASIRIMPSLGELINRKANPTQLREVTLDDLLGREPVQIDFSSCAGYIQGKVVMVTGAAGSIGSELARQVLNLGPSSLLLVDNNESGLYDLNLELAADLLAQL